MVVERRKQWHRETESDLSHWSCAAGEEWKESGGHSAVQKGEAY